MKLTIIVEDDDHIREVREVKVTRQVSSGNPRFAAFTAKEGLLPLVADVCRMLGDVTDVPANVGKALSVAELRRPVAAQDWRVPYTMLVQD